ncbi:MAG: hypothetical protein K2X27_08905 [Candidatus Obscuribacterales bacterium]|nr:hypothetical protein [Candidatus Obscuribacterales bacterium]
MSESASNLHIFDSALQARQTVACRLLSAAIGKQALSNAYLLTGRANADKYLLAKELAAYLNCLKRDAERQSSCLSLCKDEAELCQNCRWISTGEHPQAWLLLEGQGESGKIPVEKARLMTEELSKTSRYMRLVLIPDASMECLHAPAANALLKNIEEPQHDTVFILFAASQEQVLPTIVSRCQMIPLLTSFKSGLWTAESRNPGAETSKEEQERIAGLKAEFIHAARRHLSSVSRNSSSVKAVSDSQELSDRMIELSEDGYESEFLIDLLMACELEFLKESAQNQSEPSRYLSALAKLAEDSKQMLSSYVRKNNVLETFAYSLTELRMKYLGDIRFAK